MRALCYRMKCVAVILCVCAIIGLDYATCADDHSVFTDAVESADIKRTDDFVEIVKKISKGVPGATRVLVEFTASVGRIDPYLLPGPWSILGFDSAGILGSHIWMLYEDVCSQKILCVHTLMRSEQLGLLPRPRLYHAILNRGAGLDVNAELAAVRAKLPGFGGGGAADAEYLRFQDLSTVRDDL